MNTRELIEKITRLPRNNDTSLIKISPNPNANADRKDKGMRRPRRIKNADLVRYDDSMSPEERSAYYSNDSSLDETYISSIIREAYGGEVSSNVAIEDLIRTRQAVSSDRPNFAIDNWSVSSDEVTPTHQIPPFQPKESSPSEAFSFVKNDNCASEKEESKLRNSKSRRQKREYCEKQAHEVFSKNVLMRHILLEKQLESMNLESSSSSTSGT
ncbi:uncharacterized protein LOC135169967 isoform X2 [Diachasmimorpha longicaudata]|uniref:uncharacterized protein LOC135169967 isoform X2 n=1 Tax=Diachasmimorpha longicaudata TaxID=58733 RepID=UPI0030B8A069